MTEQLCNGCRRPRSVCHTDVNEVDEATGKNKWPESARAAYATAGLETATTCPKGQASDMRLVGWCVDRAVRDPEWWGKLPDGITIQGDYGRRNRARALREAETRRRREKETRRREAERPTR